MAKKTNKKTVATRGVGRPKSSPENARTVRAVLSVTVSELSAIDEAAAAAELSRNGYLRKIVLGE